MKKTEKIFGEVPFRARAFSQKDDMVSRATFVSRSLSNFFGCNKPFFSNFHLPLLTKIGIYDILFCSLKVNVVSIEESRAGNCKRMLNACIRFDSQPIVLKIEAQIRALFSYTKPLKNDVRPRRRGGGAPAPARIRSPVRSAAEIMSVGFD